MTRSYLKQEDETKKTLDAEGWIHTGDQGTVDEDGFVTITGRLKELIVTSGGENVSPVPIENRLLELLPEVSNAILVGDSLGMTMMGYDTTLPVTMEDMIHHSACVVRACENTMVIMDMPFMSYQASVSEAVHNAGRLMKRGNGCAS